MTNTTMQVGRWAGEKVGRKLSLTHSLSHVLTCWLPFVALLLFANGGLAATFQVSMINNRFSPANQTISVGDTITWTCVNGSHDTVSGSSGVPSGVWDSKSSFGGRLMNPGQTFSFTFNTAGTYPYYCTPHWTIGMVGTIRVVAPNVPPSVSITNPVNGANFSAPANITIQAAASDPDGTVTRVEFFMNGVSIGVDTAPPFSVSAANLGVGNYTFSAIATDNANATGSAAISVTVSGQAPVIISGPQSQTVTASNDVLFAVEASGSSPLAYQWFFGEMPLTDATNTSLLLTHVTPGNSGIYTVQVTNLFGLASASATLLVTNVGVPPSITAQPQSLVLNAGNNATFRVEVTGSMPLSLQWFFKGLALLGETNSTLELTNVTSANAGEYFVVVTNAFGATTSAVATLMVCEFVLSKSAASFTAAGGADSVAVRTGIECGWTATTAEEWIAIISTNAGTGPGTVAFTVSSNSTRTARSGALVIGGQILTVTQAGALFPAKNDFNHDGNTDILWQNVDGRVRVWFMEGVTRIGALLLRNGRPAPPGWRIVGTHDFDRDGNVDILWQHNGGQLSIWFMSGAELLRMELITGAPALGRAWRIAGLGDFNHDGHADFLLRHTDGYLLVWFMKGKRFVRQEMLFNGEAIPHEWAVAGVADVDNDGQTDIIWQSTDGSVVVWFMAGTIPLKGPLLSHLPRSRARIVGLNDLNQDEKLDWIWRHADGHLSVWWMDGTNRLGAAAISGGEIVSRAWRFVAPKN